MARSLAALAVACALNVPSAAAAAEPARRWEAGLLLSWLHLGEFESDDLAGGVRLGYLLGERLALEAELEHAPGALGNPEFSASRSSGALRARAGIGRDSWSVFASLAPGFTHFAPAPAPIACIAVFPPTLECQLAAGETLLAVGFGLSLLASPGERWLLRLDVEDRMLRYPEAFRRDGRWEHHVRASVGIGLRF